MNNSIWYNYSKSIYCLGDIMSLVVDIKQKPNSIHKIGFEFVEEFCKRLGLCFGISNAAYVTEPYEGGEELRNTAFVLWSTGKLGRGFGFVLNDDYELELILNYPATRNDIDDFYIFINAYCKAFGIESFLQEGEEYNLNQIDDLKLEALQYNEGFVKEFLKEGLTIFGCIYPICLETEFINRMKAVDNKSAYEMYENYIDEKQRIDCYYAKPILYDMGNDKILARYALTVDVPTIFPLKANIPFGYNQDLKDKVQNWNVALIDNSNYKVLSELTFDEFKAAAGFEHYSKFDEEHIILTLDDELLKKFFRQKVSEVTEQLINWLSHPNELGAKPVKIENTNYFRDEDGIECFVFKYKKKLIGKWLLGIVSESGAFSEMKPYNQKTEIEDSKQMLEMLKNYWKKAAYDMEN